MHRIRVFIQSKEHGKVINHGGNTILDPDREKPFQIADQVYMGKIVIAGQEVTEFDELRVASDRSIIKARQEKLDRDHQAHLRQEKLSKYKLWKPFPDNIRIDKSHIHGWGIFCNDENGIKKDTRLGITHIFTKLEEFQIPTGGGKIKFQKILFDILFP